MSKETVIIPCTIQNGHCMCDLDLGSGVVSQLEMVGSSEQDVPSFSQTLCCSVGTA